MLYAKLAILLWLSGLSSTRAMTLSGVRDQAFMISGPRPNADKILKRHSRSVKSTITRMHVTSVIVSRFARVTVTTEMQNNLDQAKEVTFSERLPEAAFISEFKMVVDGVTFVGKVKEKKSAKRQYQTALARGNSAGLVTADVRETQTFDVAANVPAHSSVTFHLVYQQLLKRKLGIYNHEIMINPGQMVDDFVINVYVTEKTGITFLEAQSPQNKAKSEDEGELSIDTYVRRSKHKAQISFKPTQTQQRLLMMLPEDDRKLTVKYDVTREVLGGEIQTRDGYFVHFFAPKDLPVFPKNVVFVIDRSGSMSGQKIRQTKTAFETVLQEMRPTDKFNLVTFASNAHIWKSETMVDATEENVQRAIRHVKGIRASGGTNLDDAMLKAARLLRDVKEDDERSSALVLLTDGEPTSGVTNEEQIRMDVRKAVAGRFSVFCLGFGRRLNHNFLKRMADENGGIARKIYEDSDADLQLEGFFQEVATPLLLNVHMKYLGSNTTDVSKLHYDNYFGGSEVIVVGAFEESSQPLSSIVKGISAQGEMVYQVTGSEIDDSFQHWFQDTGEFSDFIERIWAYYTIKELLEKKDLSDSKTEISEIDSRLLRLSLKYNFVTPLTSMIVTLPEDETTTSSVNPPIDPCLERRSIISEYDSGHPPFWCPYIIAEEDKVAASGGRTVFHHFDPQSFAGAYASLPRRRIQASRNTAQPALFSRYHSSNIARNVHENYRIAMFPLPPAVLSSCSGTLTSSTGSVSSPHPPPRRVGYCNWTIRMPAGSWVDLYYDVINTTKNEVVVTSNGENLFSHYGGISPSKYTPVKHNEISIRMTVYPRDTSNPGILISYSKFIPESVVAPEIIPTVENLFSQDSVNCGYEVSSLDGLSGFISSPNYPEAYPSNARCVWHLINADPTNFMLTLEINDLDIEMNNDGGCPHDKIAIARGDREQDLCGMESGQELASDAQTTKLAFLSDDNFEASGFKISYAFERKVPQ